jgi:oligoendopeptidase F
MTGDRTFVPADLNVADFDQLQPLYQDLLDRPLDSPAAVRRWLEDYSALAATVSEYGSRRQIEHSCHTDDAAIEKRYLHFVEQISPKVKPLNFQLQKRYLVSEHRAEASDPKLAVLAREWQADVELFRDENVPLQTQVTKLVTDYGKLCGAMLVDFRGKTLTLQQLARFLEEPDRPTRQEAWELSSSRRLQDRQKMDDIFDRMLELRGRIAANADLPDYRAYAWKSMNRFDYTPDDCHRFAAAIAELCVPMMAQLNQSQQEDLDVGRLRPWDLAVDPRGRPPLRPFPAEEPAQMVHKVSRIFSQISPRLGGQFDTLQMGRNLDLESRKGKRPGGFQSSLEVVREPFIFMNAAGVHRDVETMLHEAGHAFHYMAARDEPLVFLRHSPLEFAEVASMSMELLGCHHYEAFYDPAEASRARRQQFEGIVRFFPWMATIDQFQHWIYTHGGHTADDRTQAWLSIYDRFSDGSVDWSGYEAARESRWQAQLHLFHYPFYYVEYGIAQIGALQVWLNFRKDPQRTLEQLGRAFALGGTRPLPELFDAAGIRFDFSAATLAPLMHAVQEELAMLPR